MTSHIKRRQSGFTLAELMTTVTIIGILCAFAYPSYQEFILKGRRTEAKAALMSSMQLFERHYSQVNTYYTSSTDATIWNGYQTFSGDASNGSNYDIRAIQCPGTNNGQCIELQAIPRRTDATCGTLVLRTNGQKNNMANGTTYSQTANCW
ncbi:type IV pilin protein [Cupriavidus pauculus]|uniref:type IV pilin protein n=1 Tax=Cupriavidus pauculus TaxID=82633 RepID=UPI001247ACD2|nr:type IV pilin protein [Cupriavidus pauculus]KAB0598475.1 type IV pilin protein [Cupriavidus pauculus]MCM3608324.1 type IV pilin protein [Cupriavidus pauculus]UAL00475.1 type IV pilin protein [Cupriavidus pauculus]